MEEADLLADTVVIMRKGQVAACGSPLQLKTEHGSSLQFSLLVDQEDIDRTIELIRERFAGVEEWVDIQPSGTGNVTVAISKIQGEAASSRSVASPGGVDVERLADFASFLESGASGVREYGFSNSSLEEVFLKVTEGDEEESQETDDEQKEDSVDLKASDTETGEKEDDALSLVIDDNATGGIGSFESKLTVKGQLVALLKFMVIRDWTGRSSIANWITHCVLLCLSVFLAIKAAENTEASAILVLVVFTLTVTLLTVGTPIYYERFSGLFYLTRSQGLLKPAYVSSQVIYSYVLSFVFTFVVLSLVYATPLFRDPELCEANYEQPSSRCNWSYGDRRQINWPSSIYWWNPPEYEGEYVRLYARRTPGHYGLILGIIAIFPLTMPGSLFSSTHFPGFKLAVTVLTVLVLGISILPLILYDAFNGKGVDEEQECFWDICNTTYYGNETTLDGEEFLNCIGLWVNDGQSGALCIPKAAGIAPQIGLFQTLYMTLMSDITFHSTPPEYVEEKLIPMLSGDYDCNGSTCQFPYAREQYSGFIGYMVLGAVLLTGFGFMLLSVLSYPGKRVQQLKASVSNWFGNMLHPCRRNRSSTTTSPDDTDKTENVSKEVLEETKAVEDLVGSFVLSENDGTQNVVAKIADYEAIPRDDIPPVVSYKLRKEYRLPGGFATKLALESLDLHVSKGQVLGLLGKNGAGKSTALKIFSGGHEASAGVALVAGYDIGMEQIQAFERLGNCAQFDVIWPWETIQSHLEFFGGLKGLPKDRLADIARAVASSVGLGAPEVYTRRAGALSGGMRRRLSIAISLIGAPRVLLLDEPSKCHFAHDVSCVLWYLCCTHGLFPCEQIAATGLDPSTRNNIWNLIGSFATEERAIIISKSHSLLVYSRLPIFLVWFTALTDGSFHASSLLVFFFRQPHT